MTCNVIDGNVFMHMVIPPVVDFCDGHVCTGIYYKCKNQELCRDDTVPRTAYTKDGTAR